MKKILVINLILCMMLSLRAQSKSIETAIFTIAPDGTIITKREHVDPINQSLSNLESLRKWDQHNVQVMSTTYKIEYSRFVGWEKEPGDYDKITIFKNENINPSCTYSTDEGIVLLNMPGNLYSQRVASQYANNGYFLELPLSTNCKVLIFVGQHYGTDLASLIIFAATETDFALVYNKKGEIAAMNDQFEMHIETSIAPDYSAPKSVTIWTKDGVLWLKDN